MRLGSHITHISNPKQLLVVLERLSSATVNVEVSIVAHTASEVVDSSQGRACELEARPLECAHAQHVRLPDELSVNVVDSRVAETPPTHEHNHVA